MGLDSGEWSPPRVNRRRVWMSCYYYCSELDLVAEKTNGSALLWSDFNFLSYIDIINEI